MRLTPQAAKDGAPSTPRRWLTLTPMQRRSLAKFRANKRGYYSLWIFLVIFLFTLFAELFANSKPLLLSFNGELRSPVMFDYFETDFAAEGSDPMSFNAGPADYKDPAVQCLIITGGVEDCVYEDPDEIIAQFEGDRGWMVWPLYEWDFRTANKTGGPFPSAPDADNWLGTDQGGRDVLATVIYGVRLAVLFAFIVTAVSAVIGIVAGAVQGFFGGMVDLFFQRFIEVWSGLPALLVVLIISSVIAPNFLILAAIVALFSWTALVGVVRAEFLRARNFEYVMAARALGVSNVRIIFRHLLPNAMVATLTMLPFILTSTISFLAMLDYLGFGLAKSEFASLGDLTVQGKSNAHNAPWIGAAAFCTFAILLSLLVFIAEAVRDAFDPRKALK